MTREQFKSAVISQGYTTIQAERIATVHYPSNTQERRAAGLVKARIARSRKARLAREESAKVTEALITNLTKDRVSV